MMSTDIRNDDVLGYTQTHSYKCTVIVGSPETMIVYTVDKIYNVCTSHGLLHTIRARNSTAF